MYKVVPVREIHKGKTYSQLIPEWCNWFFMENPDRYNDESENDIKFLRSFPSPAKIASFDPKNKVQYEGSALYRNRPNCMIGSDKIVMYEDQAIFFPVMLTMRIADVPEEFGFMERWVKQTNSNSDDPPLPYQFTIDGKPLLNADQIAQHKIDTNGLFDVTIPDVPYGTSLKDFVMDPSPPGTYSAYCQGYYFLVDGFDAREESYFIHSISKGAPYAAGEYYASFTYEIKVIEKSLRPRSPVSGKFPEQIISTIRNEINAKKTSGEIDEITSNAYVECIENCQNTHDLFVKSSIGSSREAAISQSMKGYGEKLTDINKRKDLARSRLKADHPDL